MERIIRVVTAVIRNDVGDLLLVRKRGTTVFMQPGGKPEAGEVAADALIRELREEIGVTVDPARLTRLGIFQADAANEAAHVVEAEMFALQGSVDPMPSGEIEELWWCSDVTANDRPVAPLTRAHVLGRR